MTYAKGGVVLLPKKLRKLFYKTPKLLLLVAAISLSSNYAHAGRKSGGYNCNPDKKVDNPGSFDFQQLGPTRIGLTLHEGSDAATISSRGYTYKITDALGNSKSMSAYVVLCLGTDFITDGILSGLEPNSQYSVSLVTTDRCGNSSETEAVSFTTSELSPELTAPVSNSSIFLMYNSFLGTRFNSMLTVRADDDSGIDRVEYFVNGVLFDTVTKSGLKLFRKTAGEEFISKSLYLYKGQTINAEAHIYDLNGNVKVVTRTLNIIY